MIVTKRSGTPGRSFRGRVYLPGWPEGSNDADGNPSAGAIADALAWCNNVLAPITLTVGGDSVRLDPVVYSRKLATAVPMTDFIIRPFWGTIRRRAETKSNY